MLVIFGLVATELSCLVVISKCLVDVSKCLVAYIIAYIIPYMIVKVVLQITKGSREFYFRKSF